MHHCKAGFIRIPKAVTLMIRQNVFCFAFILSFTKKRILIQGIYWFDFIDVLVHIMYVYRWYDNHFFQSTYHIMPQ